MFAILAAVLTLSHACGPTATPHAVPWLLTEPEQRTLKALAELHQAHGSYLYHVFRLDKDLKPSDAAQLQSADWLKPLKAEMSKRIAYTDAEEGQTTEAQAWQAPATAVWEIMEATRKLVPGGCGWEFCAEAFSSAHDIAPMYEATEARMRNSLEQLSESAAKDVLGRPGKRMLHNYRQILDEIPRLRAAAAANDHDDLLSSIRRIGALTEKNYWELH